MRMFRSAALASALALIPACNLASSPDEAGSADQIAASQRALTASDAALVLPSDIAFNAGYGQHLAMDGDTLLAGSLWGGDDVGKVHSFRWNGSAWIEESLIRPASLDVSDRFGATIVIQGDTAAITAIGDGLHTGDEEGSVYIFQRSGSAWTEVTRLVSPTPTFYGRFGDSLALDGNTLLVGAPGENALRGIAYVYDRDPITGAWQQSGQLTAPSPGVEDGFGDAVALGGTLAVVAAPTRDAGAQDSGTVYAFRRSGSAWALEKTFQPPTPSLGLRFGRNAVAVDGDTIAIGNYEHDHIVSNGGAVYVYTRSGSSWSQQARLVAPAPTIYASVGWSIWLEGNRLVAGAHNDTGASSRSGAAYVFERSGSTWTLATKLVGPGTEFNNQFGFYVAMSDDRIAVAAIRDVTSVGESGSVFTFTLSPEPPPSCPGRDEDDIGSYCTPECPCEHGQGDCDDPEDCTTGFCLIDAGVAFGYDDPEVDVCSNVCPTEGVGAGNFCTPECPCGPGQGDCDGPEDCTTGLCLRDAGLAFGFSDREIDVCSAVCPTIGNGAGNFCTPECPCYTGQGDCDTSADCRPGLTCAQNVGASWGQPADTDICR